MPWARVETNVRLPLDLARVPAAESHRRVADALARVGLEGFARYYPRQLSGGMKMRVSIARCLVVEPNLLLMDEPFGALDEFTRNRLDADLVRLWWERKLTTVFVTHSIYEAVFLSTRVIVMGARPGRRSGHSSCRRTGAYFSARTVAAPTTITSASVRSSANRRLSAFEDSPFVTPSRLAAPSTLATMLARSHGLPG